MNVEGAAVEQHLGRTVMPRYHAGFSFGTVAAAGVAAVAAGLHVPVVVHIPVAVVAVGRRRRVRGARVPAGRRRAGGPARGRRAGEGRARRRSPPGSSRARCSSALVVLAAALTEGSANDWVSLAVVDGFDVRTRVGALAFAVFVTAMTAMRWFGTALLDRYGRVAVLRLCAALSLVGLRRLRPRRSAVARDRRHRARGAPVPRSGSRSA